MDRHTSTGSRQELFGDHAVESRTVGSAGFASPNWQQSLPAFPGRLCFKRAGAGVPTGPALCVELAGIEPASLSAVPGLLRVQSAMVVFLGPGAGTDTCADRLSRD
jgi:hypothetical protein